MQSYVDAIVEKQKDELIARLRNEEPLYAALPPDAKARVERELIARTKSDLMQNLFKSINTPINPRMSFSEYSWLLIKKYFSDLSLEAKQMIVLAWMVLIILSILLVTPFIKPLVTFTSWILLQILLGVRMVDIGREPIERKYLSL
jgi:hypothetical protein